MRSTCPDARRPAGTIAALLAALLVALSAAAGCFPPDYGTAPFACKDEICPSGYLCIAGVCRGEGDYGDAGVGGDGAPQDGTSSPDGSGRCNTPSWKPLPLPVADVQFRRVWGSPAVGGLYALGTVPTLSDGIKSIEVLRRSTGQTAWTALSSVGLDDYPWDIWGSSAADLYLVTYAIYRYQGSSWQALYYPFSRSGDVMVNGIWGSATSAPLAVVSDGTILRLDPTKTSWSVRHMIGLSSKTSLQVIWGPASGPSVFVGTDTGEIYTCSTSGSPCSLSGTPLAAVERIWGTSASDVFAVGPDLTVVRYDGSSWKTVNKQDSGPRLLGVWGSGPTDVYVVGAKGTILHGDGTGWTSMTSNTSNELRSIWGTGPRDVVAVGDKVMLQLQCD